MPNQIIEEEELSVEDAEKETEEESLDETVVPPLEEDVTERDIKELKETPKEVPVEEETLEEDAEETGKAQVHKQPKPVEGETERERFLRLELEKLRRENREKDKVLEGAKPPAISDEEYEALKEVYTDEELQKVEKLFDVIGKKKGYVRVEQLYQDKGQETLDAFTESHPEYKIENDPDNLRWGVFVRILKSDYNLEGKTPKQLNVIFRKVDRDVKEELGEVNRTIAPSDSKRIDAQKQKIKSVSHTGGTKAKVVKKSNAPTDPTVRAMFKDFDDEDFG